MKKDEIIELLKEQLRVANDTVSSLTTQVNELIERIKSLEELLVQKGIAIDKANRQNKALGKLVSGKKSERQEKNPQASKFSIIYHTLFLFYCIIKRTDFLNYPSL